MKKNYQVIVLVALLSFSCNNSESDNNQAETILMDAENLANVKLLIENNDSKLRFAFNQLIQEAETALKENPVSVTDKKKLPPSGNKHDYASYSRYWWPDPNEPSGLPYIRRDGETNPDSQSLEYSDRQRIGTLGFNTETLGLAYYLTGKEKYAIKAAELLRTWFLDEETRMNPNVNHAQIRPGHNQGTKSGVLDGRLMIGALEGSLLISSSSALSKNEQLRLKKWAAAYFEWLTTSEFALEEAASKNNHGSFYDVQALYFALYSEKKEAASQIAQKFIQRRLYNQIREDGSMPEEIARTRPLFYSIYNLHAMFLVAHLAQKVDVDVYEIDKVDSRLRAGLNYLIPYTDPNNQWPHSTIGDTDRMKLFIILQMADRIYQDQDYLKEVDVLSFEKRKIQRSNLVFPIIR
ncbi:MAG: alginate lyase family protein [Flavobacteriaceae bacterium]|nr:alginate lyase family protein [Flavobacteriaceae bacterium]